MTRDTRRATFKAYFAALWGALCVILAFPTVDLAFPVLFAFAPLLVTARRLRSWKRRFVIGWLMGFVYQAWLFRWVDFTLEQMTDLPGWANQLAAVVFAAWHALFVGLFLALAEPVRRTCAKRWPAAAPLAVAALFVALEELWPFLFPWTIGHAFWQVPPLASMMALTGAPGLSFVVMAVSAGAADVWVERRRKPALVAGGVCLALVAFGLAWYVHVSSVEPRRTLRVAIIQPNYSLEEKKHAGYQQRVVFMHRLHEKVSSLPAETYDLVVAPEGAYPFFWRLDSGRFSPSDNGLGDDVRMTHAVQAFVATGPKTDAIFGGLRSPPGSRTRNSAVHIGPNGLFKGHYDKRILVPFGEYMPGREWFPELANSVKGISDFDAGEEPCRFEVSGEVVTCGICYETMFTDFVRDAAGDASLQLNLTIDTWFGVTTAPWFHLMVHASRAVELGIPLVRAALTGITGVVDIDGSPRDLVGLNVDAIVDARVPLKDVSPPYRTIGPLFRRLCIALSLALVFGPPLVRLGRRLRRRLVRDYPRA